MPNKRATSGLVVYVSLLLVLFLSLSSSRCFISYNVFKNRIRHCFIMDNICLRVPTEQIKDFSTLIWATVQELVIHKGVSQLKSASADI
jgi:hypothetical protein